MLSPEERLLYERALNAKFNLVELGDELQKLKVEDRKQQFQQLPDQVKESLRWRWHLWARDKQRLPPGSWSTWLILAGRGFGKTRVGAETVREWVRSYRFVNLIGPTADDLRDAMIKGESGILEICPKDERPVYVGRELRWPNGSKSLLFSAEEPERLRNKQHSKLWCDELAGWRYQQEAWDMAQFGLRLGDNPQAVVTTTPKPTPLMKSLSKDKNTFVTRGTSYENRPNLSEKFYTQIIVKYENTRLGRQELQAELLEDNPGALWTQKMFEDTRVSVAPDNLIRIVVGVDPAVTSNEESDEWGIVVMAKDDQWPPHFYVLDDCSDVYTPDQACDKVIWAYHKWNADRVVAEVNNGGDLIEALLRQKDLGFAYTSVHATKGKYVRAEPIAALYEQKRAHHVGLFAKLEDQACDYVPGITTKSPDRLDSLVWCGTELSEGYGGGWMSQGARRHAEKEKPKPPVEPEVLTASLAEAQKVVAADTTAAKYKIFGEVKTDMAGKVLVTHPIAKVQTNSKTPECPTCGNKVLQITGDLRRCSCGWDNRGGTSMRKVS